MMRRLVHHRSNAVAVTATTCVKCLQRGQATMHAPTGMYGGNLHPEESASQDAKRIADIGAGEFDVVKPAFETATSSTVEGSMFRSERKQIVDYHHADVVNPHISSGGIDCNDANAVVAHVAYALSDAAFIYPITPSSPMGEVTDQLAAAGRINCFDQVVSMTEMQSEGGAAGALHGALSAGALATTFTASQGLLLMIPNMYKIAGEFLPCVIHVAARTLATHALSIFGDHQDVMAVRQTGWTMLCSESVQMAHDFAILSHLATLESRVPIIHFFDGFRTSHEVDRVEMVDYEKLKAYIPFDCVAQHRARGLSPTHPHVQGTAQGPDLYFQASEAGNVIYNKVPEIMAKWADKLEALTGRGYAFFAYEGAEDAEEVVVIMGSGAETAGETVKYLSRLGRKVGVIKVRLFRPWSAEMFVDALPKTTKRVTILDRCKEPGALADPLFLDVVASLAQCGRSDIATFGGRYGLSSKEFTPGMVISVFDNMTAAASKKRFTVGIEDDVTFMSLPYDASREPNLLPPNTVQCLFFGLGSDGTVGANKTAIKLLTHNTNLYTQAYFSYDAKKSGGVTVSHLRIGPEPIHAPYLVSQADYLAVHRSTYLDKYDIVKYLKQGGIFMINTTSTPEELSAELPAHVKRQLALKDAKLFIINANKIASVTGMGKMINMIMQTAFFKVCPVLPFEQALEILKKDIHHTYAKKSETIINNNIKAVQLAGSHIVSVPVPSEWASAIEPPRGVMKALIHARKTSTAFGNQTAANTVDYATRITTPANALEGDSLPVSAFAPGGRAAVGTSSIEKRCIALKVPNVSMTKCTQCNYCSFVCPHAAIRPFLITPDELAASPEGVKTTAQPAQGGGALDKYKYRIQVSPMDCTGCELCARVCPSDAIKMADVEEAVPREKPNWDYLIHLPNRGDEIDATTVKGSQFQQPLLEFSGACEGCGETPYVKLLTQLVGDRLVVSNATGCSSIWGASAPSVPYTFNSRGEGPAWANSLFEDNAEFGFGMRRAYKQRRDHFLLTVDDVLKDPTVPVSAELKALLLHFSELRHANKHDVLLGKGRSAYHQLYHHITPLLEAERAKHPKIEALYAERDMFTRFSHWIVGGDGWAYDIGFGGLDHVLASEEHIKVMVLDTEMYSNTGGQASKSTPTGATAKFAEPGKGAKKKDLGQYAMTYRNVYVASICLEANHKQAVKALLEAEAYPGPSIILCYSPCISQGFPMSNSIDHCRAAVESGYWPLYRYNPALKASGNNPFQLDSRTIRGDMYQFLSSENRFSAVQRSDPARAKELNAKLQVQISERQNILKTMERVFDLTNEASSAPKSEGPGITILYGSETGNSEDVAKSLDADFKVRGVTSEVWAMNDFDFEKLPTVANLIVVCSTCGLGEFPTNSRALWKHLSNPNLGMGYLNKTKFTVFGLGDSHYTQYCAAAAAFDVRLEELGATRVMNRGYGDDQADEKYYTGWDQWTPSLWGTFNAPAEPVIKTKPQPVFTVEVRAGGSKPLIADEKLAPPGSVIVNRTFAKLLTPPKYDRDIRHYEFNIEGSGLKYACGDSLAIFPHTAPESVERFCQLFNLKSTDELLVAPIGEYHTVIPSELNVQQLVGTVLNVTGAPSRRFYSAAAKHATNQAEQAELESLGSETDAKGVQLRHELSDQKVNFLDVFERYPSCRPPLAELIPMIPRIKPRLYSISSSPMMYPKAIHTTIVEVSWNFINKAKGTEEERFGISTSYLKRVPDQSNFAVQVMKSAIVLPSDPKTPVIMVGMGTGIAPWRALSQQKACEKAAGVAIGPVRLYFGARKESQEFLYREEFKSYEAKGVLTLRTAFSRDQATKIYVQHRLEEDGAIIFDMMHNKNGHFYVCGSARQLPVDIYDSMKRILLTHGGAHIRNEADAEAMLASWKMQGRYTVEAFS